ncbi:MAG TPA: trypsin-like peptidase domain-containing protein [Solirubrobacteraceae bacterium]
MSQRERLWSGGPAPEEPPAVQPELRPLPKLSTPEPPADEEPRRRSRTPLAVLLSAVAGAAVIIGLFAVLGVGRSHDPAPLRAAGGRLGATQVGQIYARASRGVVSVAAREGGAQSTGTGFLIDRSGTIVTNAHVVGGAGVAQVRFGDQGRTLDAPVLGRDASSDLAVLRVDPSLAGVLHPLALADSSKVRIGDVAVAIGNPFGLDRTATAGIVSGLGRHIQAPNGFDIDEVIQTDAPINPGNSGGPLLDARARVIGVNSQIETGGRGGGNVGIGFAVPANTVREVVPRLEQGKPIVRPFLGLQTSPVSERVAAQRGLRPGEGAFVESATSGGPAQDAGIRYGDVVTRVAGHRIASPADVADAIAGRHPGDDVEVEIVRSDGTRESRLVTLGARPAKTP